MNTRPFVLATDLDGTFAAGAPAHMRALIAELAARPESALIYVTGRSVESARALIARAGLPTPIALIADVGTTVVRGVGPVHMDRVERELGTLWPGENVVRKRLARVPGLELQDVEAVRRVSYWITANRDLRARSRTRDDFEAAPSNDASLSDGAEQVARSTAARAASALHDLEVDIITSGNVYLDVLPHKVNKGSTLLRVLAELQLDTADCVVAGDSLNDCTLFEIGARGIVVGNCEPRLRTIMANRPHVFFAEASGAGGILEGLRFLRVLPHAANAHQENNHGK